MSESTIQSSGDMLHNKPSFDKPTTAPMNQTFKPSGDTLKENKGFSNQGFDPKAQEIMSSADTTPIRTNKA